MSELSDEDTKLLALAKQARGRIQASEGAAVRDETGRSYSGATVALTSTNLTALQLAVAQAVAAGARDIEGAVIITKSQDVDLTPIAEVATTPTQVFVCSTRGDVTSSRMVEASS